MNIHITGSTYKCILLFLYMYVLAVLVYCATLAKSSKWSIAEFVAGLFWLPFCCIWVLAVNNIILYLFFLELLGLLALCGLLYTYCINDVWHSGKPHLNVKYLNATFNTKFLFIRTVLFFLWSSAISMILLFWGLINICTVYPIVDLSTVDIFFLYHAQSLQQQGTQVLLNNLPVVIFLIAICLKSAILPLHPWLVTLYNGMSIPTLMFYITFYYIYVLLIILNIAFSHLYLFNPVYYIVTVAIGCINLVVFLATIQSITTVRQLLAYSSVINIYLLAIILIIL